LKVLVVGSGGREHAIAWKIKQNSQLEQLYCAPGNAGTAQLAQNVPIDAENIDGLLDFVVSHHIDLTVVGPEGPLVAGIVNRFQQQGLRAAGPSREASRLEGSKAFAKDFMTRHAIPTGGYEVFDQLETAETTLKGNAFQFPVVLKADGLAAGKGVFICPDLAAGLEALNGIMRERKFGASGDRLVIEEFLEGEEASFMVFTDGVNILPMVPSQDHKAIYEGDQGPNTGGMGAYSIDAILSTELRQKVLDEIIDPTIKGMAEEGNPYQGILYAGLMITPEGPKVLEFNVRFGDPETQVVLPRMESDLLDLLYAMAEGNLENVDIRWSENAAVCVVIAAKGYPGSYEKGEEISGLDMASEDENTIAFHAGTALKDGKVVTNGGRVLGMTSVASTLHPAIMRAYEGVNKIHFEGMYCRRDIASKGLERN
jgi:phosphoribosylamine--glycine ligase